MKKIKGVLVALLPFITAFGAYLTFYPRIESKPNHVGFWFILALGMSIGIALTRIFQMKKEKDIQ